MAHTPVREACAMGRSRRMRLTAKASRCRHTPPRKKHSTSVGTRTLGHCPSLVCECVHARTRARCCACVCMRARARRNAHTCLLARCHRIEPGLDHERLHPRAYDKARCIQGRCLQRAAHRILTLQPPQRERLVLGRERRKAAARRAWWSATARGSPHCPSRTAGQRCAAGAGAAPGAIRRRRAGECGSPHAWAPPDRPAAAAPGPLIRTGSSPASVVAAAPCTQ